MYANCGKCAANYKRSRCVAKKCAGTVPRGQIPRKHMNVKRDMRTYYETALNPHKYN